MKAGELTISQKSRFGSPPASSWEVGEIMDVDRPSEPKEQGTSSTPGLTQDVGQDQPGDPSIPMTGTASFSNPGQEASQPKLYGNPRIELSGKRCPPFHLMGPVRSGLCSMIQVDEHKPFGSFKNTLGLRATLEVNPGRKGSPSFPITLMYERKTIFMDRLSVSSCVENQWLIDDLDICDATQNDKIKIAEVCSELQSPNDAGRLVRIAFTHWSPLQGWPAAQHVDEVRKGMKGSDLLPGFEKLIRRPGTFRVAIWFLRDSSHANFQASYWSYFEGAFAARRLPLKDWQDKARTQGETDANPIADIGYSDSSLDAEGNRISSKMDNNAAESDIAESDSEHKGTSSPNESVAAPCFSTGGLEEDNEGDTVGINSDNGPIPGAATSGPFKSSSGHPFAS